MVHHEEKSSPRSNPTLMGHSNDVLMDGYYEEEIFPSENGEIPSS